MKRIMVIGLILVFIAVVPFTVLGEPKSKGTSSTGSFVVSNPNHTQALGGSSTHASNGLSVAAQHSPVVHDPPPPSGGGGVPVVTPIP